MTWAGGERFVSAFSIRITSPSWSARSAIRSMPNPGIAFSRSAKNSFMRRRSASDSDLQRLNHEEAVAAVGVVAGQALGDDVAEVAVELLRAGVDGADFEADHPHVAAAEAVLDFLHQAVGQPAAAVLR